MPREAWSRLWACTAAAALLQIDGTLITVALPQVARGLHTSSATTSVVLSVYFVSYALVLLPGGALVDRFGSRRLALVGLALFAVGAAAGALASSITVLVVTRVIQGAGAGLVSPAALAGAVSGFPAERRGSALGIWGASAGVSNLIGPLLGGLATVALGWRANWWLLVPMTLFAAAAVVRYVPRGAAVPSDDDGPAVFNQVVAAATLVAALTFAVMIGTFYLAEQYLQRRVGYSALGASSVLILVAVLVGFGAPLSGRLVDRRSERSTAMLGFGLTGAGLAILSIPGLSLHSAATLVPLLPVGLGLGMLFVPASRAALNANPLSSHGRTSAVLSVGRLLGAGAGAGAAGLALASGITATKVHTSLLVAAVLCLSLGVAAAAALGARRPPASEAALT